MLESEVAKLLVFSASIEGREATDLEVAAWAELLTDVDYDVAVKVAKSHYRDQPRRLWPADIIAGARRVILDADGLAWAELRA